LDDEARHERVGSGPALPLGLRRLSPSHPAVATHNVVFEYLKLKFV
jgi:hypothetical protein